MQTMYRVDVAVAHEDPVVDAGLRFLLHGQPGIELLAPGPACRAAVVIADYRSALAQQALVRVQCRAAQPSSAGVMPRFLILATAAKECEVRCALNAGIQGYLLQGSSADEIVTAVRALGRGSRHLCREAMHCIANSLAHDALTQREADVLCLLSQGLCNKAIGRDLGIALGTVKSHVKAILEKLEARTRTEAVVIAAQRGLLDGERTPPALEQSNDRLEPPRFQSSSVNACLHEA